MKKARKAFDFLIYTNILLSLFSGVQVLLTNKVFHIPFHIILIVFEILSVFCAYGFSMIHFHQDSFLSDGSPRQNILSENYGFMKWAIILSGIGLFLIFPFLSTPCKALIALESILVYFYSKSFPYKKGKRISFRKVPALKVWFISFIWAISLVLLPLLDWNGWSILTYSGTYIFFLQKYLVFFVLCLLFDFRDLPNDRLNKLITLPTLLGEQKTKYLAYLVNAILLLLIWLPHSNLSPQEKISFTLSYMIFYILIIQAKPGGKDSYYMVWVDGSLVLPYCFLILLTGF